MFASCKQQSTDKVKSELSQILHKVYSEAYADHYGTEQEDETHEDEVARPSTCAGKAGFYTVSKGSKRTLKEGQKLATISENSFTTSAKYEKKQMQKEFQTNVIGKWIKSGK